MARTPPPSRRTSAPRKQPSAGPSKPRKTRVPSKPITSGPSNMTNLRSRPRRSNRLSTPITSDLGLSTPSKAATRLDKGKARMRDLDEMTMDVDAVVPSEAAVNAPETVQRVDKGKGRMMVDDMVNEIRALRVSEPPSMQMGPPTNSVNALQLVPYAPACPNPATPLRRESRLETPHVNAKVVPPVETRRKDVKPKPQHPPFDFKPLLRKPRLLVPQEVSNGAYFDAEKRLEAQRVRNAVAIYRMRNLEGIVPFENWDLDDIVSWAHHTPFVTGKLFKPVHIPRPDLDPLCINELSNISLMYYWVRRVATLAGKAVSMTIPTPLARDLHTRWEVMNTKASNPYFGYMCFMPYSEDVQRNPATVVIGVQTPFGLNPNDFMEFVRGGSASYILDLPFFNLSDHSSLQFPYTPNVPLQGKYYSWANLYDACKLHGTRWFVHTSYTQWVFGMFSVDYATASVSPIYSFNTQSPNIVELVAYWFASARNAHGAFVPPKIDIAVGYKLKEALNKKFGMTQERPPGKPPTRQDYWDGKYSELGTKTSILTRTDGTAASLYPNSEQVAVVAAKVTSWNLPFPEVPPSAKLWDMPQAGFGSAPPPLQGAWMVPMQ